MSASIYVYQILVVLFCIVIAVAKVSDVTSSDHSHNHDIKHQHLRNNQYQRNHQRGRSSSDVPPRKIFIDLGTNNGSSIAAFVNGDIGRGGMNIDGSSKSGNFTVERGVNRYDPWHVYAFEPNIRYNKSIHKVKDTLISSKNVSEFHVYIGTAISTYNGKANLILDTPTGGSAGATLLDTSRSAVGAKVSVHVMDILTLFHKADIRKIDYVCIKVDIEGGEFSLVRRMILHGLLPYVDKIAVEWHHLAYFVFGHPSKSLKDAVDEKERKYLQDRITIYEKYKRQYDSIQWLLEDDIEMSSKFHQWSR